jgi:DNA-binding transcriptional regulator YiaG
MFNLIVPTPSERLVLWRRRHKYNQKTAARIFDTTAHEVLAWEQGKKSNIPYVELYTISEPERCFLVRYRNRLSNKALAATLEVDPTTLSRWENGKDTWQNLVNYYENVCGWHIDNKYYI